jgi:branched-chain amino acid transport system substrate-binding protein
VTTFRQRLVAFLAIAAMAGVACGTRLPDEAFQLQAGQLGEGIDVDGDGVIDISGVDPDSSDDGLSDSPSGGSGSGATRSGGGGGGANGDAGGGNSAGGGSSGPGKANYASDTGVTATEIRVGNVTAIGGPLGPETFSGGLHGARAYFLDINSRGGINGRKVSFNTCDDKENPERNKACTRSLIDDSKVFGMVASATDAFAPGSAQYMTEQGVPDVGSQPIGSEYYKWPTLYSILGAEGYTRDGSEYGQGGRVYVQTGQYRWFKQAKKIDKAAVIFYAAPAIAKSAGEFVIKGLEKEGIEVVYTPNNGAGRNPADPNFDQDVIGMQQAGAQGVWQTIDTPGFQRLCRSIDRFGATEQLQVVVGAANTMTNALGSSFSSPCRNHVYINHESWPFSDTQNPEVVKFQAAMQRYDPNWTLSQWAFEGWIGAKMFAEGVASMGADVTRKGLIQWLDGQRDWNAGGAMAGVDWRRDPINRDATTEECFTISQWQDSAKGWTSQAKPFTCYDLPWVFYTAS